MSASGGTRALVDRLTQYTKTREHGQVMTWLLGLVVFFDDYANTLLVGSTMRPVSDRLRISREKLAFLVDSTAAPVAGLAIVSTWVGFEVGQIGTGFGTTGHPKPMLTTCSWRRSPFGFIRFCCWCSWARWPGPAGISAPCESAKPHCNPIPRPLDIAQERRRKRLPKGRLPILNAIRAVGACCSAGSWWDSCRMSIPTGCCYTLRSAASLTAGLTALLLKSLSLADTVAAGIKGCRACCWPW